MNPEQLFTDIVHFVEDSRKLLKEGAMMELAGLDTRIQLLCRQVLQLSEPERLRYAERLQKLFDELEALGQEMIARRESLAEELRHTVDHKKANVAYRTTDAIDGFGDKEDES